MNPREDLNQIQLVEQVVLEPQDQLIVRGVPSDRRAPLPQVVSGIQRRVAARPRDPLEIGRPGELLRPYADQFGIAQSGRNWPFVQWVCPNRAAAWDTGRFYRPGGGRAVGDVQEARLRSSVVHHAHSNTA